jgi:hypothetical protein
MKSVDFAWIWALVIVIGLVVFWKPLMGGIQTMTGGSARKDSIARGKVIFYETERWAGKGSYMSCAMCHAADFVPEKGKTIKMPDYKAGSPISLKGTAARHSNIMTGDDKLFEEINDCLGQPSRMNVGKVSAAAPFVKDLMAYVKSL